MTRQGQGKSSRAAKHTPTKRARAVLLFGESDNDRRAVKELAEGLNPELHDRIQIRRRPMILIKNVIPDELARRVRSLTEQVRADQVRFDVRHVLVHEDCDDVEPAHEEVARRYESEFGSADYQVHPVLPAWELETWWLLWPRSLPLYRSSWRAPTEYCQRHVGKIANAKEALQKAVMPRALSRAEKKRFRTYEESDSPGIAAKVRELGLLDSPEARSDSYRVFCITIKAIHP